MTSLPDRIMLISVLAAGAAACSSPSQVVDAPANASAPAADLRKFTGTATKIVWVQGNGSDPFAAGTDLVLMGLSTEDAHGERAILSKRQSYVKPLLTPTGTRVLFSTRPQDGPEVFLVNWDGSGLKRLTRIRPDRLAEPDGHQRVGTSAPRAGLRLRDRLAIPIDDPRRARSSEQDAGERRHLPVSEDDASQAGCSVAECRHRRASQQVVEKWATAADGMATGAGRCSGISTARIATSPRRLADEETLDRSNQSGARFQNPEVYHPRWTNHPRFMAMSGPNQGGANQVRSGGAQTEVWLGRPATTSPRSSLAPRHDECRATRSGRDGSIAKPFPCVRD